MQQIGPYRVEEEIGRGGMATVYRVTDPQGLQYALKLLHAAPSQDKRWGTRFRREFRLLSRLRHNHLIEVHDYGEDEHHAYYVMDYIDGTNLWKFYRNELRGKSVHERLAWLIPLVSQIVSALDYIHHHRVIHKDLKPANILLQHNGESAYLVDFGLARDLQDSAQYTHPGFMGTLGYSAPELVDRGRFDGRADIYSLGVILYTLLADRRPIQVEGRNFQELLIAIREEVPYPIQHLLSDLPPEVGHIINRCIEKSPAERYRDTRELWQDLLPLIEKYHKYRAALLQEEDSEDTIPPTIGISEPLFESHETSSAPQGVRLMESELLGRSREIDLCETSFTQLSNQQQSSVTLLYGLPGIGKTFLLEEFQRRLQRHSGHVYSVRLRPNASPLGSLTEAVKPLLQQLPTSFLESNPAQLLAQYLPGLQDIIPPPKIVAGPLTQPVLQLTNLLLPFLMQYTPQQQLVWLIDDLDQADPTSKRVLSHLISTMLSHPSSGFLLLATLGYQTDDKTAPFLIAEHPQITHHYMMPLTEEEESLLVTRLLGRTPKNEELQSIRSVTRGLPLRTIELVHQGSLLAQGPFQSMEATNASALSPSEDIMSSVSTALHELSSFQEALGLNRTEAAARQEEFVRTAISPSADHTPLFAEEPAAEIGESTMLQSSLSSSAADALELLSRSVENESTIPAPIRRKDLLSSPSAKTQVSPSESPKEALFEPETPSDEGHIFNPERTVMMKSLPLEGWGDLAVGVPAPVPSDQTQPGESLDAFDELSEGSDAFGELGDFDEESIHELASSDEILELPSQAEVGESTMLQEDIRLSALALTTPDPEPDSDLKATTDLTSGRYAQTLRQSRGIADTHEQPPPFNDAKKTIAEPLVPKQMNATIAEDPPSEDGPTGQHDLMQFSESSEELVLVPLLKRRLEMLDPAQRLRLAVTSFLTEEFTYEELLEAIQSTPEEALDLLNMLLSMRLLKVEVIDHEEYYSYLHPVMKQILAAEIPPHRQAEFSLRAARAMANARETFHRQFHASLLARRFTEASEPIKAFEWQLYAVMQALQVQHVEKLEEALGQLQQLLSFWSERGAQLQLLQVLPRLFESESKNVSLLSQTGQQLLLVGVLHVFAAKDTVVSQSQKARELLKQLLALTPGTSSPSFKMTIHHLGPLLQFARLRIRKKK